MRKVELTSPAGNAEKGRFALDYGADSVYIGFPGFSLRSGAESFGVQELENLTGYAHSLGKKVYLALNIFAHNRHLSLFEKALEEVKRLGPDGIILADPGLILMAREKLPDLHITVSTQANTSNYQMVKVWEKLGVQRVVLARELSVDEIAEIRDKTSLELEVFVHGAVCMAYSGRCLLSGFMTSPELGMTRGKFGTDTARHANLGSCTQPCRWNYLLVEENRRDMGFPIEEDKWGTYILSAKDICLVDHLSRLMDAGVDVFKIEGRMKSIYYVANVTRVYRRALELAREGKTLTEKEKGELFTVSHRGYTTGFTFPEYNEGDVSYQGYIVSYKLYAVVEDESEAPYYRLKVYNAFSADRELEVIRSDMQDFVLSADSYSLYDLKKEPVTVIRHQYDGYIKTTIPLKKSDIIRIKVDGGEKNC